MSLQSPLARAIGHGAAGKGTEHWWQQRVTAAGLALLGAWFVIVLLGLELGDRAALTSWMGRPFNAALLALLVLTMAWHSHLGTRVIVEDYAHGAFKVPLLVMLQFLHAIAAAVGLIAILRIAAGAA